jgi:hypothetical protein
MLLLRKLCEEERVERQDGDRYQKLDYLVYPTKVPQGGLVGDGRQAEQSTDLLLYGGEV